MRLRDRTKRRRHPRACPPRPPRQHAGDRTPLLQRRLHLPGRHLRWNQALERDELSVSALLQTPGHLDDGTQLDYAWALGVREHAGQRIYRHGGSWAGLNAQLVRLADQRAGFVIIALDDDRDRTATLTQAMIEELTTQSRTSQAR